MNVKTSMVLLFFGWSVASADTAKHPTGSETNKVMLTDTDARALTLGLKLAGVAGVKAGGSVTYAVTNVSCSRQDGDTEEDGLDVTSCQIGTAKPMASAQSALLHDALLTTLGPKGLPLSYYMRQSMITVESVTCKIGPDLKPGTSIGRFSCDSLLRFEKK